MRLPRWLAWVLVGLAFLAAGLQRQFHDATPTSPYAPEPIGSSLFAVIFLLLLVSVRESRRGAVGGPGVRLGSLIPLLLILFVEKWFSQIVYLPLFGWWFGGSGSAALLDAQFRALAGVGLIAISLAVAPLTLPTARKCLRRSRPRRLPTAIVVVGGTLLCTYGLLALVQRLGGPIGLHWPTADRLWLWVVLGQSLLAVGEEFYYRGLLMSEVERLAPRLGVRAPGMRRWTALLLSAGLFGLEHIDASRGLETLLRESAFVVALGLLLGLLVMLSANLPLAAGLHAFINCLLLGATPYLTDGVGNALMPPGPYIGVSLIFAFAITLTLRGVKLRNLGAPPAARRGSPA